MSEYQHYIDRIEDAMADAQSWRQAYDAAITVASIWAPPDMLEVLEDQTARSFIDGVPR